MQVILSLLILILMPLLLLVIDRKIKSGKSIIVKIVSAIVVASFLMLSIYFYGEMILESFSVNLRSFTNMKSFFNSRVFAMVAVILLFLFVLFKLVLVATSLRSNDNETRFKSETGVEILTIVFDIATIPNIVVLSMENVLFVVPLLITIVEIGLVSSKLVFSIASLRKVAC